jgi:hypothetical protein
MNWSINKCFRNIYLCSLGPLAANSKVSNCSNTLFSFFFFSFRPKFQLPCDMNKCHCQSRILIHGSYGIHKESSILAELYRRSEKGEAFKSRTTIFLSLKLTPNGAHVSPSLFSFPSALTACRAGQAGAVCLLYHLVVLARDALP